MIQKILARIDIMSTYHLRRIVSLFRCLLLNLRPTISIRFGTIIESNVKFKTTLCRTYIKIGNNCQILSGSLLINNCGGYIEIGDNSTVNYNVIIYGHGGVKIGNGVRIAADASIISFNHQFEKNKPIYLQGLNRKGISIEDDVWIGNGAKILDGVTLGKGCIIGAGSVVTKSTEPYGIYVGSPARLIKYRE